MAKLSKTTRTVIIAAAVLLVLGAVFLVLTLTKPSDEKGNDTSAATSEAADTAEAEDTSLVFTDKEGTQVLKAEITNSYGSYTFDRASRVVSTENEDGTVATKDEFYWQSAQLNGAPSNESTIKAFMNCLAGLTASELVESDAEDLEKYGLQNPNATAVITFEDGTEKTMHFGIINPSATSFVYCREKGSSDVYMISYYSVSSAYSPVTDFVKLSLTPAYSAENPQELDYFIIDRKDLEQPIEIAYMYDVQEEAEKEDSVVTTFNSHRITSPIVAEIDYTRGQTACYGLYGLSAGYCVSVDPSEELLKEAGLDDPYCTLTFKYGGTRYVISLGNEIINITESADEGTPDVKTVVGYYGMIEGSNVLYAFATDATPWYTIKLEEMVSRRPVSPYIYACNSVEIKTPDGSYTIAIEGNAESNSFTCNDKPLDGDTFRKLYQFLISSVGEELYRVDGDYELIASVTFNYREQYHAVYGTASDTLEFYKSDDRKSIIRVNGEVLFKVRQIYTDRLIENVNAMVNGGEILIEW